MKSRSKRVLAVIFGVLLTTGCTSVTVLEPKDVPTDTPVATIPVQQTSSAGCDIYAGDKLIERTRSDDSVEVIYRHGAFSETNNYLTNDDWMKRCKDFTVVQVSIDSFDSMTAQFEKRLARERERADRVSDLYISITEDKLYKVLDEYDVTKDIRVEVEPSGNAEPRNWSHECTLEPGGYMQVLAYADHDTALIRYSSPSSEHGECTEGTKFYMDKANLPGM